MLLRYISVAVQDLALSSSLSSSQSETNDRTEKVARRTDRRSITGVHFILSRAAATVQGVMTRLSQQSPMA